MHTNPTVWAALAAHLAGMPMPAPAPLPGRVLRPMPDDLARLQALLAGRTEDPGEQLARALRICGGARVSELAAAAGVSPWVMRRRVAVLIEAGRAEAEGQLVFATESQPRGTVAAYTRQATSQ